MRCIHKALLLGLEGHVTSFTTSERQGNLGSTKHVSYSPLASDTVRQSLFLRPVYKKFGLAPWMRLFHKKKTG